MTVTALSPDQPAGGASAGGSVPGAPAAGPRLASLAAHGLTRPLGDADLDALVELLAVLCHAPRAALSIPTEGRVTFVARCGLEAERHEVPVDLAPCADVVAGADVLVVPDLAADPRFAAGPLAAAGVAFYAGAPVLDEEGHVLASLCVLDTRPRDLTVAQRRALEGLARQAGSLLALRRRTRALSDVVTAHAEQVGRLADAEQARELDRTVLATQTRVLGMVATGQPLTTTLDALAREVEAAAPGARCSILLLDAERSVLRDGAGPSLPGWYREAIDGTAVADGVGCCGTAAATGSPVLAVDVATDPRWVAFRDLAAAAGIASCWSSPIRGSSETVLGTFALYYDEPREPSPRHRRLIQAWTDLAGVAIRRELAQRRLEQLARHDSLTGLPNRAAVSAAVAEAVARRGDTAEPPAVLFVDLDRFKVLNDSLGHAVGDRYLRAISSRLRARLAAVAPTAVLGRLGGDEFAVVLPATTTEAALAAARALLAAFADPVSVDGRQVRLSGSIGVALADEASSADTLLRDADAAMYEAKRRGHGQVEVFDGRLRAAALSRLELEVELRAAIAEGHLSVAYQPEYRLDGGELAGVEALARWTRPDGSSVPPGEFIPVAEDSGLVVEVGELVLRQACAQAAAWRAEQPAFAESLVWVNLSARQLELDDLPDLVARVLADTGLPGDRLGLEITESAVVDDVQSARGRLAALKELGVRLAIDDFGTGWSGLGQLIDLPVDVLKVDRSFVSRLPSRAGTRVVAAIVQLAHALGMQVIAEGVETPEQLRVLRTLGCDEAQGYLLGRPGTSPDLQALLAGATGERAA